MSRIEVLGAREFRLALAFAVAIAAATVSAFALIYFQVSEVNVVRIGAILAEETRINLDANVDRLRQALAARQTPNIRRVDYVALFDAGGAPIVGNLSRVPPIPVDGAAHYVAPENLATQGAEPEPALFAARRRSDGGVLVLGRNLRDIYDLQYALRRVLTLALLPTVVVILAIGAFFARRATRRLNRIHSAITRIIDGDLQSRLPVSREDDQIDRIARAVNVMLDEIARLLDQLKSVGDNIAHDLRTPLMAARTKLERALEAAPDLDAARPLLVAALDRLDKAAVTIAALLRISSVENGLREERFGDVDLAALCEEALEFYEPFAETKSIAMTASCAKPLSIRGDEDLMREAIWNIVDNALKFTPPGGAVHIEAAAADGRPFVEVRDTGPGVAPAERDTIFRRFYRVEAAGETSGHGLGLSIAQTIARLHGFELTVEDAHPGARFVMKAAAKATLALSRA